jgi:hypothetical protein
MYKYGWIKKCKEHNEKNVFYNISNDQIQKLSSPKNERAEKT